MDLIEIIGTTSTIIGLIFVSLLLRYFFQLYQRDYIQQSTQVNEPAHLPNIPIIKQLLYLWWVFIGLWPTRRCEYSAQQRPVLYRVSRIFYAWMIFVLGVMLCMLAYELITTLF